MVGGWDMSDISPTPTTSESVSIRTMTCWLTPPVSRRVDTGCRVTRVIRTVSPPVKSAAAEPGQGNAADEVPLGEQVDDDDRQQGDRRGSHQKVPLDALGSLEEPQSH